MCEGVEICPKTGQSIETASCRALRDFGMSEINSILELPTMLQLGGESDGSIPEVFFSTGWTSRGERS